ncbi:MAG: GGDEF domain-containing protein [Rhodocyclaceae bacterium]|nr:MAG: GGDEF domain-containing protein [Rhodocyclaceae bacterium]
MIRAQPAPALAGSPPGCGSALAGGLRPGRLLPAHGVRRAPSCAAPALRFARRPPSPAPASLVNPLIDVPALLWVVAFQMGLYALMWLLSLVLLQESRRAVAHWVGFMLLLCAGLMLAAWRSEPRLWWAYNGTNAVTVVGFALMRRGTERFLGLPARDREQLAVVLPTLALLAWLGPGREDAPLRIVATYCVQAWILARTLWTVRPALAAEFGRRSMLGIVVPGALMVVMLLLLAGRQWKAWPEPTEMQVSGAANVAVMLTYLSGCALFSFGFLTMVTQRLVMRLREASMRDALTGLFNRRAMNEALQRAWLRHRRSGAPLAALVIDLDHFKRINDTAGHAAGDAVLVQVGALLLKQLRGEDVVGRAGGEEFWLVLPDTRREHAVALAERLRLQMAEAGLGVTCSIGVALAEAADGDAGQVIARADAALYRAKTAGRNRVESG